MAREPLNGGGFHLIAGVWNTSASKHSAAKRVQDCFVGWAGWDGPRSSLLQGLVDSLYNPFIKGSEAGLDEIMALVEARKRKRAPSVKGRKGRAVLTSPRQELMEMEPAV